MSDKTIDHRLAWLAGIIDGEGWVGFGVRNHSVVTSTGKRWRGPVARYFVEIANTSNEMVAEILSIAAVLGIKPLPPHLRHQESKIRKPMWRVIFRDPPSVAPLLRAVYPWLVAKRAQAELTLRAMEHRRTHRRGQPGYVQVGSDPVFREMQDEAHRLNRRGVASKEE